MRYLFLIALFSFLCVFAPKAIPAQHTVGLLSYDFPNTFDGYNLLFPHNQSTVYLLDNCGEIVNAWEDDPQIRPGNSVYLMPNGDLVKCSRHSTVTDDIIWAGGGGEFIEIRDWDNNLKWRFTLNDSLQRIHHDIAIKPDGNILAIVWERRLKDEAIAAGRDTALLSKGEIWSEAIIEIQPEGDTFQIVWEWHVWDHMIQDYDPTKASYGVVADHPELVNINWGANEGTGSWMHANAIDYHPVLRQILLSVPTFDEIWIIDQSTTTEEASGHIGGLSGRGGDLMFRWGNPAVYDRGDSGSQTLFFQHDAHWVDVHLGKSHPHFGKIAVYNNRVGVDSSRVGILNPLFIDYGWMYGIGADDTFLPEDFDWGYSHPDKTKMFSGGLSSVQLLPNGNTLICAGTQGNVFEVTGDDNIVWEYKVPLRQGNRIAQGEQLVNNENTTWRVNRYPDDYPAFTGRDLSGKGFIELDADTAFCNLPSATINVPSIQLLVYPNPVSGRLTIACDRDGTTRVQLLDQLGNVVLSEQIHSGYAELDVSHLTQGLYFVQLGSYPVVKVMITK